jgi:hypothetical protein
LAERTKPHHRRDRQPSPPTPLFSFPAASHFISSNSNVAAHPWITTTYHNHHFTSKSLCHKFNSKPSSPQAVNHLLCFIILIHQFKPKATSKSPPLQTPSPHHLTASTKQSPNHPISQPITQTCIFVSHSPIPQIPRPSPSYQPILQLIIMASPIHHCPHLQNHNSQSRLPKSTVAAADPQQSPKTRVSLIGEETEPVLGFDPRRRPLP